MRHGSLFSGIGGGEYAAELMGWENVFHCELNSFGRAILNHYYPTAESYSDIKQTSFKKYAGTIDVITGGWPCQDNSNANQSKTGKTGLQGERSGLFHEFARCIHEVRPRYVVAENVSNVLHINANRDFRTILTELARLGFNAEWRICYAGEVGAPHKRPRLFVVAYPDYFRLQKEQSFFTHVCAPLESKAARHIAGATVAVGKRWDFEPPVSGVHDGLSVELDTSAISKSKWLTESVKALGNAIVPQIPYLIFKAIEELDPLVKKQYAKQNT